MKEAIKNNLIVFTFLILGFSIAVFVVNIFYPAPFWRDFIQNDLIGGNGQILFANSDISYRDNVSTIYRYIYIVIFSISIILSITFKKEKLYRIIVPSSFVATLIIYVFARSASYFFIGYGGFFYWQSFLLCLLALAALAYFVYRNRIKSYLSHLLNKK